MRKLVRRLLACLIVLLFLAGCFVFWFLKFGGGDDPIAGDEDLLLATPAVVPAEENGFVPFEALAGLIHLPRQTDHAEWPVPAAAREAGKKAGPVDLDDFFHLRMVEGKAWDDALAAAVLERNQQAFELIAEILARPRFQMPPSQELERREKSLGTPYRIAVLLTIRSLALARDGHTSEAIDAALQSVRLGRRIEEGQGILEDYCIAVYLLQKFGLRSLRLLVPRLKSDEIQRSLADLKKLLPGANGVQEGIRKQYNLLVSDVDAVAAGELSVLDVLWLPRAGIDKPPTGAYKALLESVGTSRYLFKPLRTRRLTAAAVRVLLADVEKPFAQRTQGLSARCGVPFPQDQSASNGIGAWMAEKYIRVIEIALKSRDELQVDYAATRVLLALRAHKLESGALPETLTELIPRFLDAVPRDPFDGAPLRYSQEKLRIWSVGSDLADSGGGELSPDGQWSPPEEDEPTFRIE